MPTKANLAKIRELWARHKKLQEQMSQGMSVHDQARKNWGQLMEALDSLLD